MAKATAPSLAAPMADDIERLIAAMAKYIVAHGGEREFPDPLIDLVLETLEGRKHEQCRRCGLSIMEHSIEFFENGTGHNFEGAVKVTKCS
jgi:hypothetical protein